MKRCYIILLLCTLISIEIFSQIIAPYCKVMPVRIFNSNGSAISASGLVDAINFAKNNGAHVISNSWGYDSDNPNYIPAIKDAIADATTNGRGGKGSVVVFSAGNTAVHSSGNNGFVCFPSNVEVEGVLTVGASDRYDQQADYSPTSNTDSSYNQIIDIVAPSHRAYSCNISMETLEAWTIDVPGDAGYNRWKNTESCYSPLSGTVFPNSGTNHPAYTGYFGGTSCSCPEVAAVAALMLSMNPELTQQDVFNIINSTARKAGGYSYQITAGISNGTWNAQMAHGVLDAYAVSQQKLFASASFINIQYKLFMKTKILFIAGLILFFTYGYSGNGELSKDSNTANAEVNGQDTTTSEGQNVFQRTGQLAGNWKVKSLNLSGKPIIIISPVYLG